MIVIEPAGNQYAVYDFDPNAEPPRRDLKGMYPHAEAAQDDYPKALTKSVSTATDFNHAMKRYRQAQANKPTAKQKPARDAD